MDKQRLFDRVWTHFYENEKPSGYIGDTCVYKQGRLGCAIGIQPEFKKIYSEHMESSGIRTLWYDPDYQGAIAKAFDVDEEELNHHGIGDVNIPRDIAFLVDLQDAHDQLAFAIDHNNNWREVTPDEHDACLGILKHRLEEVAYTYGLETP